MPARIRSTLAALAAVLMLAASAVPAGAYGDVEEEVGTTPVIFDSLFLRPIGIVTFLFGSSLFVAGLPLILITRPTDIGTPFESLVVSPARYVWADPIGEH